jgi:acyl carrier protein
MSDIADRVSNVVVSKLHVEPDRVNEAANFLDDFAATSLDIVETIMSLEDEFDIEISDRDAESLRTVGDIVPKSRLVSRPPSIATLSRATASSGSWRRSPSATSTTSSWCRTTARSPSTSVRRRESRWPH